MSVSARRRSFWVISLVGLAVVVLWGIATTVAESRGGARRLGERCLDLWGSGEPRQ